MIKNQGNQRTEVIFGQGEDKHMEVFRDLLDCESVSFVRIDKGFGRVGYSVLNKEWPKVEAAFRKWQPLVNDITALLAQP